MIIRGAKLVIEATRRVVGNPALHAALVLIPAVWIGYFVTTASERASALRHAQSQGDSVAKILQENAERIFEQVDQSLRILRELYARDPAHFSLKFWAERGQIASGDIVQFGIIGLDGYMRQTTVAYAGPPLYLGDREHFVNSLRQAEDVLYVAPPVLGRATKRWTIQVARKIYDADKAPIGIIIASIDVGVFDNFMSTAKLGTGGSFILRNADFVVLAAEGLNRELLGQRLGGEIEQGLRDSTSFQFWGEGRLDKVNRLVTARKSTAFPLISSVAMSEENIFARSDTSRGTYLAGAVLLTLVIMMASWLYLRRQKALDQAQHRLSESLEKFEDALANLPQGMSMFDGSDRLIAFNQQYLRIYGLSQDDVRVGATFQEIFAEQKAVPDLNDYLLDLKRRIAASGRASNTVGSPDGRVICVSYSRRKGGGWVATHEDITERKASEDRIEKLAHYDSLTGLANRNLFKLRIEEALARHRRLSTGLAVLLMDLDKFKAVNDALGHQSGDSLLKEVAGRIRAEIREIDTPARIGGDEFALIVTPGTGSLQAGVAALAERLIKAIAAPYQIDGAPVSIGCSIGIAIVPEHGERIDEILRNADLALYKSKNAGRNCFHVYSSDLRDEADRRNVLEVELREAIWGEEIEVFYQPVVELGSGKVRSVEALARWRHKTKGFISPGEFIPLAEEAGMICELGDLVLVKACRDATRMPNWIKVAVNLSPTQFAKTDMLDSVIFGLACSGLPEGRLELEITETFFLDDSSENIRTLERLKRIGVSIALDDFGVGYSSLSYLTAFPFDKVKIDKSFVEKLDKPETGAVLASIVQLAKSLNLSLVAEGIETREQAEQLRSLGVTLGQGYFFGTPQPLADLRFERVGSTEQRIVA